MYNPIATSAVAPWPPDAFVGSTYELRGFIAFSSSLMMIMRLVDGWKSILKKMIAQCHTCTPKKRVYQIEAAHSSSAQLAAVAAAA